MRLRRHHRTIEGILIHLQIRTDDNVEIAVMPPSVRQFEVLGLAPGAEHRLYVRTMFAETAGQWSPAVTFRTPHGMQRMHKFD